jgi:chromosomal replication initiator protein
MNAREAWSATLGQLQVQLNRATYDTWLGRAEYVGYEDGRLVISVPHAYARDWLERNLVPAMTETFSRMLQTPSEIQLIVWDLTETQPDVREVFGLIGKGPAADADGLFNPAQTFESFVITPANTDAVLFARFVLDSPFGAHSTLYISGAAGVGKTHLIQAMANQLLQRQLRIIFVTAEQFTAELVAALRRQDDMTPFRDKYRGCDVLVMDQVEFLESKERSEQELRFIWDTLSRRKRLMIFAGRRLPRDLHVHADLRACLNRWMVCTINPPDADSCTAILTRKAEALNLTLSAEARDALLTCANFDLSMIEGALAQVGHYARLTSRPLTATLIYSLLRGRIGTPSAARAIDLPDVLTATAEQYGLTLADLTGKNRSKAVTQARHLAMHLARTMTDASLPQIGLALGGRDHSTVLHGCERIGQALPHDTDLRAAAEAIADRLRPKLPIHV